MGFLQGRRHVARRVLPLHYIVAGYANLADAEAAAAAFRNNGAQAEDVRAFDGDFVVRQLESRHGENWLQQMESKLVDFVGTEKGFIREDADLAQHGPKYARRYLKIAIERIVENAAAP
jgi:hypothetical protein